MTPPGDNVAEKVRVLLELDRNDEAGRLATDGLRSDPNNAVLLGLLAYALEADGFSRDARMWAERSLAVDPQQAWVLSVRARAILSGAGAPHEAVQSAYAAVQLDLSEPAYRYTLTRAYLGAKQRDSARATAESIRAVAPTSALGPLAQALVEIDRARFFHVNPVWAVIAVIITRGVALLVYAIMWLFFYVRRRGPLRRADAHLLEALRLDPGNATTHAIAAHVARFRFRYVQAVDSALASAAIDTGMVDAGELARGIVRRTCGIALAAFAFWAVWLPVLNAAGAAVAATVGTVLGFVALAGVAWLYREQTKRLPAGVLRLVHRRWELPATALVIAVLVVTILVISAH
jgi:tetratricopeptide (TPR) repeat protein